MKKRDRMRRQADETMNKVRAIARHIRNVEDNCLLLGEKLIEKGEVDLGRQLIANGFVHDASKFSGIEFEYMAPGIPTKEDESKLRLKMAIHHHNSTNKHHPEAWPRIQDMPRVFLAECVCDWKARSEEFGTSLRDWILDEATKRFHFMKDERVCKEIMEFVDMLCQKPFDNVGQS